MIETAALVLEPKKVQYDPITGVPSEYNEYLPKDSEEYKKCVAAPQTRVEWFHFAISSVCRHRSFFVHCCTGWNHYANVWHSVPSLMSQACATGRGDDRAVLIAW